MVVPIVFNGNRDTKISFQLYLVQKLGRAAHLQCSVCILHESVIDHFWTCPVGLCSKNDNEKATEFCIVYNSG